MTSWSASVAVPVSELKSAVLDALVGTQVQQWEESLGDYQLLVCISKKFVGLPGAWAFLIVKVTGTESKSHIESMVVWGGGGVIGKPHHKGLETMVEQFKKKLHYLVGSAMDSGGTI